MTKFNFYIISSLLICLSGFAFAETTSYTVKKGDTLYSIAKRFNVPLQVLKNANRLTDADTIKPGMVLTISGTYTVEKGDTLYGIARKFTITLDELLAVSGRKKDDILKAGETIAVPAGKTGIPAAAGTGTAAGAASPAVSAGPAGTKTGTAGSQGSIAVGMVSGSGAGKSEPGSWPLSGERFYQDGKLPRIVIHGRVGESVVSVAPGRIIWVGVWGMFGKTVFVQSKTGYMYIYAGGNSISVKVGDEIQKGMEIGTLGLIPGEKEPVLHFFVYKDGRPVHPEKAPRG